MQTAENEEFVVVGLSARVRNDRPSEIGELWARFRENDVGGRLDAEASSDVYCVYHDYAGGTWTLTK